MNTFVQSLVQLSNVLWSTPIIILLFGSSLYFTVRCKFVQVRDLKFQFSLLAKPSSGDGGITPFEAFCNTCVYRIGNSNISGVAIAVLVGGPVLCGKFSGPGIQGRSGWCLYRRCLLLYAERQRMEIPSGCLCHPYGYQRTAAQSYAPCK